MNRFPSLSIPKEKAEPSQSFLNKVDEAKPDLVMRLIGIPTGVPREEKLAKLTPEQEAKLKQIEEDAIAFSQRVG